MAILQEETIDGVLHLTTDTDKMEIPLNYGAAITCNGKVVPSARVWELIGFFLSKGKQTPREHIVSEVKRSEIYRQEITGLLVWTQSPQDKDVLIEGSVYARPERQRIRILLDAFNIKIAKIDAPTVTVEILEELFNVCETLGLYPVASVDDRYFFAKDPDAVYKALGTTDWQRCAVYFKRPSSSHINIRLDPV
jgi:hypothetical protein